MIRFLKEHKYCYTSKRISSYNLSECLFSKIKHRKFAIQLPQVPVNKCCDQHYQHTNKAFHFMQFTHF